MSEDKDDFTGPDSENTEEEKIKTTSPARTRKIPKKKTPSIQTTVRKRKTETVSHII